MKRFLLLALMMCGRSASAVDPVAVWNGDFKTKTIGTYTLFENGNTIAADGSSITISTAKGVTFERSSALANSVGMTVIVKFSNLVVGSAVKTIGTASAGGGNADRVGVNVQVSGQTSGIWANTSTYNTGATQTTVSSIEGDGQFAFVYGPSVSNNTGTYLYLKNGSADYTLVYSCGGLKAGNDTVQAMTVGGTRNNGGTFPAATDLVIKAVAVFDQALSKSDIAAYTTAVTPSVSEGKSVSVSVETNVETYTGGRVTLTIPEGALNLGTYTEDQILYKIVFADKIDAVAGEKQKDGTVMFVLPDADYVAGQVYRGQVVLDYGDGEVQLGPVTVYEGERQFVWTPEGELWVNETAKTKDSTGTWTDGIAVSGEKLVVNAASGVTFTPTANSDYVETCDSTFTVSISAREAVDAASDPAPAADVQGGVRIASVGGVLKVQALADGVWTDLKSSGVEVDRDYEVVVAFHYAKEGVEGDADSVSYTLDGVTVTGGKVANTVAKVSSVEVADGTSLAFLKGICQLDKAVIVDMEIDPADEKPIEAKDLAAAQAIADKMVVAISEEVAKVVDATTYRGYFKVIAKPGEDGKFHAIVEFLPGVQESIEEDIEDAMEKVVAGFETGSAEIAAKPGLYYGVKRGDAPAALDTVETTLATGAKVTITITKPEKSNSHFYRIICSPTPSPAKLW